MAKVVMSSCTASIEEVVSIPKSLEAPERKARKGAVVQRSSSTELSLKLRSPTFPLLWL